MIAWDRAHAEARLIVPGCDVTDLTLALIDADDCEAVRRADAANDWFYERRRDELREAAHVLLAAFMPPEKRPEPEPRPRRPLLGYDLPNMPLEVHQYRPGRRRFKQHGDHRSAMNDWSLICVIQPKPVVA